MAKLSTAPAPAEGTAPAVPPVAPPAPVADHSEDNAEFAFDFLDLPAGRVSTPVGEKSEMTKKIAAMPAPTTGEDGKVRKASFLVEVKVPDTITDTTERDNYFRTETRKLTNRLSGNVRRVRKQDGNSERSYSVLTVADAILGYGVRVYRTA